MDALDKCSMSIYQFKGDFIVLDRIHHNGHVVATFPGHKRIYIGHNKRDVLRMFKKEIKEVK